MIACVVTQVLALSRDSFCAAGGNSIVFSQPPTNPKYGYLQTPMRQIVLENK